MAFTNIAEIGKRLGRVLTDSAEIAQVGSWIGDVESLIRNRIRDIDERITAGDVSAEELTRISSNAVIRKVKNPDGKQNERIDDYSYGLVEDAAKGELFLTDDEWASLEGFSDASSAFTIRMAATPGISSRWEYPWL